MQLTKLAKNHWVLAAFLLACLIYPFVIDSRYLTRVAMEVFFFAAMGNAWNIIGGYGKQTSWASSTFVAVGAYTSILLFVRHGNISPWISMIPAMGLAVVLAIIIGLPCFRMRGVYFAIATIACTTIFRQLLIYFSDFTGGSLGVAFMIRRGNSLWNLHFDSAIPFYFIALAWLLITVGIVTYIERNRLGHYLRAICDDQDAAESLGIKSSGVKLTAFIVSGMMLSVTGVLYVFQLGFADPNTFASHDMSVRIAIVAILGGMGNKWGPTVGALVSVPLLELSNAYLQHIGGGGAGWVMYGLLIVIIVLFKPNGIISIFDNFDLKKLGLGGGASGRP
ncbi:MAG: branched-chain amino acid ABC transporter permease [Defluviitaleaceae bacterium]|nr:branched-chain amino acid ABC transporter permease [Defluviitaleaceae bacterium]